MFNKKEKGFTLVELVVVIAIIAVLAGVLLVAINPAAMLAKGRDAKRLEDLDNLNKAISLGLAEGEITLTTVSPTGTSQAVDGSTGWVQFGVPATKTGLVKYIPALPLDPTNTAPYVYTYGARSGVPASAGLAGYELNAVLESPDNVTKMSTDGGNNANVYEVGTALNVLP